MRVQRQHDWHSDVVVVIDYTHTPGIAHLQSYAGGVPSVLVSRDVASSAGFLNRLVARISACKGNPVICNRREELYSTGHLNSPRDSFPAVAIHPAFRTAALHHVSPVSPKDRKELDSLGQAAYFGESAFNFKSSEFAGRYWGVDNHNRLLETKQAYDPKGVFGCRNCVGSEGANAGTSTFDVCVCECVVLFLVQLLICAFSRFRCFEGSLKHHVAQPFPVLGEPSVPALSFLNTAGK